MACDIRLLDALVLSPYRAILKPPLEVVVMTFASFILSGYHPCILYHIYAKKSAFSADFFDRLQFLSELPLFYSVGKLWVGLAGTIYT